MLMVFALPSIAAEITFTWCCGQPDRLAYFESVAAQYEALNPGVKVVALNASGETLRTLIAGGQTPDIMWQGFGWTALVGLYEPVDWYLDREPGFREDLDPNMLREVQADGSTWGLPLGAATNVMGYNEDLLAQGGVAPPEPDWTWDELLATARRLTRDTNGDGVNDVWGLALYWWPWNLLAYGGDGYNDDGTATDLNNEVALEAWRIHYETWSGRNGLQPQWDGIVHRDEFASGNLVFYNIGIFDVPYLRDNMTASWNVQTYPWLEVGGERHRATWATGEAFMVHKDSPVKEQALDFLRFMLSPEQIVAGVQGIGIVPASRTLQSSDLFLQPDKTPANMKAFVDSLAFGKGPFQGHMAHPEVWAAANPILSASNSGELPIERYHEQLIEAVNRALAEWNARNR